MGKELKVVHCGLGPIGQSIARLALETEGLKVVGALDISPDKAGRDLGPVLGLPKKVRVKVEGNEKKFLRGTRGDVAVLCTTSSLKAVRGQLADLMQRGYDVVSTCEELAFPSPANAALFRD